MISVDRLTPAIGATVAGVDFSSSIDSTEHDRIYQALLEHQVIFFRGCEIAPAAHLAFAQQFGDLGEPHPHYPHVAGHEHIMLLENDALTPPDTNSWHTDLTYKREQPFASILVARKVPEIGGDTLWSSLYAAYDRLPSGMQRDLAELEAIHDLGDFRNRFAVDNEAVSAEDRLDQSVAQFGHCVRPLIGYHPVTKRPFLNFNEAFVTHVVGMTTGESTALRSYLANHMNRPEDQIRWRWKTDDIAMWDNRVTMHYAVADYSPNYRCMNRITVVRDRRVG